MRITQTFFLTLVLFLTFLVPACGGEDPMQPPTGPDAMEPGQPDAGIPGPDGGGNPTPMVDASVPPDANCTVVTWEAVDLDPPGAEIIGSSSRPDDAVTVNPNGGIGVGPNGVVDTFETLAVKWPQPVTVLSYRVNNANSHQLNFHLFLKDEMRFEGLTKDVQGPLVDLEDEAVTAINLVDEMKLVGGPPVGLSLVEVTYLLCDQSS